MVDLKDVLKAKQKAVLMVTSMADSMVEQRAYLKGSP